MLDFEEVFAEPEPQFQKTIMYEIVFKPLMHIHIYNNF
jgi:hypothetical protein